MPTPKELKDDIDKLFGLSDNCVKWRIFNPVVYAACSLVAAAAITFFVMGCSITELQGKQVAHEQIHTVEYRHLTKQNTSLAEEIKALRKDLAAFRLMYERQTSSADYPSGWLTTVSAPAYLLDKSTDASDTEQP